VTHTESNTKTDIGAFFDLVKAPDLTMHDSVSRAGAVLDWAEERIRVLTAHHILASESQAIGDVFEEDDIFANTFWELVMAEWACFDRIDHHRYARVFTVMRSAHTMDAMPDGDRFFFEMLPETLAVYRGGDASTVLDGLSWTLDWEAALEFAKGHRGLLNPNPVVISGTARKEDVVFATNVRCEKEIVVFHPDLVMAKRVDLVLFAMGASSVETYETPAIPQT
jgi:hypothetical protein